MPFDWITIGSQAFAIDFVPNLYRVMASNPDYLEANWAKVKAVMFAPGKLDRLTKEIIAVSVSAGGLRNAAAPPILAQGK